MFEYLINREELYAMKEAKEQIADYVSIIEDAVKREDFEELDKLENSLLGEYGAIKMRIDLILVEDNYKQSEMDRLRLFMSTINEALLHMIEVNPNGNLAKTYNKK